MLHRDTTRVGRAAITGWLPAHCGQGSVGIPQGVFYEDLNVTNKLLLADKQINIKNVI